MISPKQIVESIEAMEKENNDLKIENWKLKSELEEQKKEAEKWKEIALRTNKKA